MEMFIYLYLPKHINFFFHIFVMILYIHHIIKKKEEENYFLFHNLIGLSILVLFIII
jgi:hypothetical protein